MPSKVVMRDPIIISIERIESLLIDGLVDFRNFDEYADNSFNTKRFIMASLVRVTCLFNVLRFATTSLWNSVNIKVSWLNLFFFYFYKANSSRADVWPDLHCVRSSVWSGDFCLFRYHYIYNRSYIAIPGLESKSIFLWISVRFETQSHPISTQFSKLPKV